MKNIYNVLIIGGGATGLYLASRLSLSDVAIVEASDRVGKKLLATGNGKCNLFNADMAPQYFNAPDAVSDIILSYDVDKFKSAFNGLGLSIKCVDGRFYPYSETAASVLDAFRRAIAEKGVKTFVLSKAVGIKKEGALFKAELAKIPPKQSAGDDKAKSGDVFNNDIISVYAKTVVVATGTAASFGLDSSNLLLQFGHTGIKFVPSLAPILTEKQPIKGLNGVRVKAAVSLNGKRECGEILFKDFGISGIAAFNLSCQLARGNAKAGDMLSIDFAPDMDIAALKSQLLLIPDADVGKALAGLFHSKVKDAILTASGLSEGASAKENIDKLSAAIKNFRLKISGIADKSLAQVMSGGVSLDGFDKNLMSKYADGLYAAGEVLNVDGLTGGYNLAWAWASAERIKLAIENNRIKPAKGLK